MAKKLRTPKEHTTDPAAQQMLIRADELALGTAFSRADRMSPCNIGSAGMCCKLCGMGPCRLTKEGDTGICGATIFNHAPPPHCGGSSRKCLLLSLPH